MPVASPLDLLRTPLVCWQVMHQTWMATNKSLNKEVVIHRYYNKTAPPAEAEEEEEEDP